MVKFQFLIVLIFYFDLLIIPKTLTAISHKHLDDKSDTLNLRLISTVFRHGDRTIDRRFNESYPNDPYRNNTFYPEGDGQLTKKGKRRSYKLGQYLRKLYNDYLGDIYYPPNVYARSTSLPRTKMTLQLVLAGLYPPVDIQKWNPELSWQPIDFIFLPNDEDIVLLPMTNKTYKDSFKQLLNSPEVKQKIDEYNDLIKMVSNYAGYNNSDFKNIICLYNTLYAEFSMGLDLPEWTQKIFPEGELLNATLLFFELQNYRDLNSINGQLLLNYIIDDMEKVINGTLEDRKINLFSGHDVNVYALLHALNATEQLKHTNRFPAYTSSVIMELLEKDGTYFVKVLYYLGKSPNTIEITIPGCKTLCPYDEFIELLTK